MKQLLITAALLVSAFSFSQVGIGTTSPSSKSVLDLTSTTKGFLPPRMTYVEKTAIVTPPAGLQIWCIDCGTNGEMQVYNGTAWTNILGSSAKVAKPDAPTSVVAIPGTAEASVAFIAPANALASGVIKYIVTRLPGGFIAEGAASPIIVSYLTPGTSYTFTVVATNGEGSSAASAASAPVTIL